MIKGKFTVLKNQITACDYNYVLKSIDKFTKKSKFFLISPIASQTLSLAYYNFDLKYALCKFDLLVPDSQWVKRSLHFLYGIRVKERVYGPNLMQRTCKLSEKKGYRIFLYGTTKSTLNKLSTHLKNLYPNLIICGIEESKYKNLSQSEKMKLIKLINQSQANILFIGLGSPLQEMFAIDLVYKSLAKLNPITIITVGAAFDFISGNKKQAPLWMQNIGLEWFFRLINEPSRLWKRYIIYGTIFPFILLWQKFTPKLHVPPNYKSRS